MKVVSIDFKDGDTVTIDCMDMAVNQGFITIFLPEDEDGNKTVHGYNTDIIESWTFRQNDREDVQDEGISSKQ